jgi:hypothetical protein
MSPWLVSAGAVSIEQHHFDRQPNSPTVSTYQQYNSVPTDRHQTDRRTKLIDSYKY